MSDTSADPTDEQTARVNEAIDELLARHDPTGCPAVEFRGHQYDAGLAWVHHDEGAGGMSVRPELQSLVERRLAEAGLGSRPAAEFFLHLAGPTIATHGTQAQRDRFLRPMFTGEEIWCQLFSEPGAGSDFAGLGARAVKDGDEWVVNGQKVWNTLAHLADRGMLVTRSDPSAPKHKGMTYFACDMHAEGVEVRPLRQITGEAEFNEVYLTDARIPDGDRIGGEGEGWRVALTTLGNERSAIGGAGSQPKRGSGPVKGLVELWNSLPEHRRSAVARDRVADVWIHAEVLRLTNLRAAAARSAGNPGAEGSIAKLAFTRLNKELTELEVDLLGTEGAVGYDYTFRRPETLSVTGEDQGPRYAFLRARANSIEGGTSEVMLNILGEQVLGLPREPRVDRDIPWNEVPRS
ncbi:MAG: acyl-CoA dehydrogenase family protein [Microthrixaceae bacterium]|nr:acyl-CoA dehydrogenase family protein [Microthrixaceae bacterium]